MQSIHSSYYYNIIQITKTVRKFQGLHKYQGSLWPEDEGNLPTNLCACKEKNTIFSG